MGGGGGVPTPIDVHEAQRGGGERGASRTWDDRLPCRYRCCGLRVGWKIGLCCAVLSRGESSQHLIEEKRECAMGRDLRVFSKP